MPEIRRAFSIRRPGKKSSGTISSFRRERNVHQGIASSMRTYHSGKKYMITRFVVSLQTNCTIDPNECQPSVNDQFYIYLEKRTDFESAEESMGPDDDMRDVPARHLVRRATARSTRV